MTVCVGIDCYFGVGMFGVTVCWHGLLLCAGSGMYCYFGVC